MSLPPVNIPDADGGNVYSIAVFKASKAGREIYQKCGHRRITVDDSLTYLICRDCNEHVSPTWWIQMIASDWRQFVYHREGYEKLKEAAEKRTRTKCQHCGQMTRIRHLRVAR